MDADKLIMKRNRLRKELRAVEQEICGIVDGHVFQPYGEWAHSGKECGNCKFRIKELCHYVDCKCLLPHSTSNKE